MMAPPINRSAVMKSAAKSEKPQIGGGDLGTPKTTCTKVSSVARYRINMTGCHAGRSVVTGPLAV